MSPGAWGTFLAPPVVVGVNGGVVVAHEINDIVDKVVVIEAEVVGARGAAGDGRAARIRAVSVFRVIRLEIHAIIAVFKGVVLEVGGDVAVARGSPVMIIAYIDIDFEAASESVAIGVDRQGVADAGAGILEGHAIDIVLKQVIDERDTKVSIAAVITGGAVVCFGAISDIVATDDSHRRVIGFAILNDDIRGAIGGGDVGRREEVGARAAAVGEGGGAESAQVAAINVSARALAELNAIAEVLASRVFRDPAVQDIHHDMVHAMNADAARVGDQAVC